MGMEAEQIGMPDTTSRTSGVPALALAQHEAGFDASTPGITPRSSSKPWWMATGLLALMTVVFAVATALHWREGWLGSLRAFAEAAMVGALADWFAVTALFRRPLGLPIPHTAIVPANKSRIGRSLGLFVQHNFLSEHALEGELVNISGGLARWLGESENRYRVTRRVRELLPQVLQTLDEDEVRRFIDVQVEDFVSRVDFARAGGKILRMLTANGMHEVLVDEVVQQSQIFFRTNRDWFRGQLREASPWFIPEFVDRRIFESIVNRTEETFSGALKDRNHELRLRIHSALVVFIEKLEHSDELQEKGREFRTMLLSSDVFRTYVRSVRDAIVQEIQSDIRREDSTLVASLDQALSTLVTSMSASPELQTKLNRLIRGVLRTVVGNKSNHVANLISRTIDSWDTTTLVSKLEEQVGHDLQYIRINGTIVGGLIGVLLYLVSGEF